MGPRIALKYLGGSRTVCGLEDRSSRLELGLMAVGLVG